MGGCICRRTGVPSYTGRMSENKNKIKKEEKEIQFFIERLAEVPIEQVKGGLRDDFRTMDWVEIINGFQFSAQRIEHFLA